jgi:GNAT superfamily N-acetyltransferase
MFKVSVNIIRLTVKKVFISNGHTPEKLSEMSRTAIDNVKDGKKLASIFKTLTDLTTDIMGTRPHYFLSLLFTHPDHYRRGAGKLLTRWGTEKADEVGVECYVESSIEGKSLYTREGFVESREVAFSMKEYGEEEDDVLCFMVRPKRG